MYWVRCSPILIPYQAQNQLRPRTSALSTSHWKPDIATRKVPYREEIWRGRESSPGQSGPPGSSTAWSSIITAPGILTPLLLMLYSLPTRYSVYVLHEMYWVRCSPILIPYQAWNQLRSRLYALSTNGWKPDIATRKVPYREEIWHDRE